MNAATAIVPLVGDEIKFTERQIKNFWRKVDKNGPTQPNMDTPCWVWTGPITRTGYSYFGVNGKMVTVHRVSWMLEHRRVIPRGEGHHGVCVCHHCDNKLCVRADHLFLGTHTDNMRDKIAKGRDRTPYGDVHYARVQPERLARGEDQGSSKLTTEEVRELRALYKTGGFTYAMLGAKFGVSKTMAGHIIRRKAWVHVSDDWI